MVRLVALVALFATAFVLTVQAKEAPSVCTSAGLDVRARCASVKRPLDPAKPDGVQIEVHYAVLPAQAQQKHPDPVFFFAGGPGQGAMSLASLLSPMWQRLNTRRDLVFIDQRGTGISAPLHCPERAGAVPLAQLLSPGTQWAELGQCLKQLQSLPHGDLRHYATWVASLDVEAVRQAVGAAQINLIGGSYGTRAALDYQRQFPQAVRRTVIDGVVPPDMALSETFDQDNQAALDAVFAACEAEAACRNRHPQLRSQWRAFVASLPKTMQAAHPLTGELQSFSLERSSLMGLVRGSLYMPAMAAALPAALAAASLGRLEPLLGLASGMSGRRAKAMRLAEGMHFAVMCTEEAARPGAAPSAGAPGSPAGPAAHSPTQSPGTSPASSSASAGQDFAGSQSQLYAQVCAQVPKGPVPAGFYALPVAQTPVLALSGGADPATPPQHALRALKTLGPLAKHSLVPQAGHGVMGLPCMRNAVARFIDATTHEQALAADTECAATLPRPAAYVPVQAGSPAGAASAARTANTPSRSGP